jgi:hypothetical protein
MTELNFNEYWFVYLKRNPDYDRSNENRTKELMKLHFAFIDEQIELGNMFVAIPMESGGLYFFDGKLEKEFMKNMLAEEGSIKGGVFLSELKKAYIPDHHVFFTLESKKRIEEFHQKRRESQSDKN